MPVKGPTVVEDDLTVRPPLQRRSAAAWRRILDAGVGVLENEGYEGFTIAAVCAAAAVPPRAIYDRVRTKEGLFLAVYEHGMSRLRETEQALFTADRWVGLTPRQAARAAVAAVVHVFTEHETFLRSVVLTSGAHAEVRRRGSAYVRALEDAFVARVRTAAPATPETLLRTAFAALFSTCVVRVAYGAGFVGPSLDEDALIDHLTALMPRA